METFFSFFIEKEKEKKKEKQFSDSNSLYSSIYCTVMCVCVFIHDGLLIKKNKEGSWMVHPMYIFMVMKRQIEASCKMIIQHGTH